MVYPDARCQIRSGDLIAFRGKGPVSWLIRHVTGGFHTHVGVAWWFRGRLFILEAREGIGVTLRAACAALPFDWIRLSVDWSASVEDFAFSQLGKPYSYIDALGAGLGFPMTAEGYICSEYAAEIFWRSDLDFDLKSSAITPTALVEYWIEQGASLNHIPR
ncbi:hypothetical protein SAMN04515647_0229 [Cohaesibacter sp. ES.047]|uniref:hypothetical protein n=1 Tax=Cohaesibacter sp. ES.047 TaxID=1798205 RepID=UPI000BB93054|nr:hypothetical protein [Cohaesibacter sp. ES.047]SNY90087.1 hypothetical protein SAMN04515647_0229 [Cohaesibacter sp. ES.047]